MADKEGWLTKSNAGATSWKKRWFVLQGQRLLYYEKPQSPQPKGEFALAAAELTATPHAKAATPHIFQVVAAGRTTHLCADSREQLQEWFSAIMQNIGIAPPPPIAAAAPHQPPSSALASHSTHQQQQQPPPLLHPHDHRDSAAFVVDLSWNGSRHRVDVGAADMDAMSVADIKQLISRSTGVAATDIDLCIGGDSEAQLDDGWLGAEFGLEN